MIHSTHLIYCCQEEIKELASRAQTDCVFSNYLCNFQITLMEKMSAFYFLFKKINFILFVRGISVIANLIVFIPQHHIKDVSACTETYTIHTHNKQERKWNYKSLINYRYETDEMMHLLTPFTWWLSNKNNPRMVVTIILIFHILFITFKLNFKYIFKLTSIDWKRKNFI